MPDPIFEKISTALGYRPVCCLVYEVIDGKCQCGNATCRATKHPNPSVILQSDPQPGQRYGILCGASGLVVIDIDVKKGSPGAESYAAAQARFGPMPNTMIIGTPSGGWHVYTRRPPGLKMRDSKTAYGNGIDVKGAQLGLVIVDTKGGYSIVHDAGAVAELPAAWAAPLIAQEDASAEAHPAVCDYAEDMGLLEWARARFRAICKKKPGAVEGNGGQGDMFPWELGLEARRLGLPPKESVPIVLQVWNTKCQPPWATDGQYAADPQRGWVMLQRKIESAWVGASVECIGARFLRYAEVGFAESCARIMASRNLEVHATPEEERAYLQSAHATSHVALLSEKQERQIKNADHAYTWQLPSMASNGDKKNSVNQGVLQILLNTDVWAGVWQYNEFAEHVHAVNPPMRLKAERGDLDRTDVTSILLWLESTGRTAARDQISEAIHWTANQNAFHPVREYLESLPNLISLDHARYVLRTVLAQECFGFEQEIEFTYIERTMIAAVRRVENPGVEMHSMLVLVGAADRYKSRALKALFGGEKNARTGKPGVEWFRDQMPKLDGRDASHALHGKWGIEFSELGSIIRSDNATVKEFLSRAVDEYRQFRTGEKIILPRQCVFLGTTNDDEFLRDETGNRRYWICKVEKEIDLAKIHALRDVFWSAAKMLSDAGEPHWMSIHETQEAEPLKSVYVISDPWTPQISEVVKRLLMNPKKLVTTTEVLNTYAGLDPNRRLRLSRAEQMRVSSILRKLGYANRVTWDVSTKQAVRAWYVHAEQTL